ncbi:MAG: hypothetical protein ACU0BF_10920 [Paracoccaceae bacterium]
MLATVLPLLFFGAMLVVPLLGSGDDPGGSVDDDATDMPDPAAPAPVPVAGDPGDGDAGGDAGGPLDPVAELPFDPVDPLAPAPENTPGFDDPDPAIGDPGTGDPPPDGAAGPFLAELVLPDGTRAPLPEGFVSTDLQTGAVTVTGSDDPDVIALSGAGADFATLDVAGGGADAIAAQLSSLIGVMVEMGAPPDVFAQSDDGADADLLTLLLDAAGVSTLTPTLDQDVPRIELGPGDRIELDYPLGPDGDPAAFDGQIFLAVQIVPQTDVGGTDADGRPIPVTSPDILDDAGAPLPLEVRMERAVGYLLRVGDDFDAGATAAAIEGGAVSAEDVAVNGFAGQADMLAIIDLGYRADVVAAAEGGLSDATVLRAVDRSIDLGSLSLPGGADVRVGADPFTVGRTGDAAATA